VIKSLPYVKKPQNIFDVHNKSLEGESVYKRSINMKINASEKLAFVFTN